MKIAGYVLGLVPVLALLCVATLPAGAQEQAGRLPAVTGFGDRPAFAAPHPGFEDPAPVGTAAFTAEAAAKIAPAGGAESVSEDNMKAAPPGDEPGDEDDGQAVSGF